MSLVTVSPLSFVQSCLPFLQIHSTDSESQPGTFFNWSLLLILKSTLPFNVESQDAHVLCSLDMV